MTQPTEPPGRDRPKKMLFGIYPDGREVWLKQSNAIPDLYYGDEIELEPLPEWMKEEIERHRLHPELSDRLDKLIIRFAEFLREPKKRTTKEQASPR